MWSKHTFQRLHGLSPQPSPSFHHICAQENGFHHFLNISCSLMLLGLCFCPSLFLWRTFKYSSKPHMHLYEALPSSFQAELCVPSFCSWAESCAWINLLIALCWIQRHESTLLAWEWTLQFPQLINGSNIDLIGLLRGLNVKVCYWAGPDTNNPPVNDNCNDWIKAPMFSWQTPLCLVTDGKETNILNRDSIGVGPIHLRVRPLTLILLALCPA